MALYVSMDVFKLILLLEYFHSKVFVMLIDFDSDSFTFAGT